MKYKVSFNKNHSHTHQLAITSLLQDCHAIKIVNTYPIVTIGFLIVETGPGMGIAILTTLNENGCFDLEKI